ncbi:BatD family protein [Leptospira inadai]|nr:BatD family protein [Leptospira inadai]
MNVYRAFFLFIFLCSPVLAGEPRFYLSQSRAELGDPVFAVFELEGAAQVRILEKEVQGKGIKAVYWGMEDNTTILNYKAYRRKLLKYRLVVSSPGRYEVPEIGLEVDGKKVHSGVLAVEFGPKRSSPRGPGSIWSRFFSNESDQGPADENLKVVFQLDKKEVWAGQPVLGFFTLYYKDIVRPYFDRDPSSSIEFPYFRSEILSGMNLNIPETVVYEGVLYETFPYNKEFFILTPLKSGDYSLGSTAFHLEGQLQSYFHMRTLRSIPGKIRVRPLPTPSPANFEGAVGKFQVETEDAPEEAPEGEPFLFKIVIKGKGNLAPVQDPIREGCGQADCFPEITLVQSSPQREFRELDPGEYGFSLHYSYLYSALPSKQGLWNPGKLPFVFFDPYSGRYSEVSIRLPTVKIGPPSWKAVEPIPETSEIIKGKTVILVALFLGIAGAATVWFVRFRTVRRHEELLKRLDDWIGSKRGLVLKHSILAKGISEDEASLLIGWKSESSSLASLYPKLDSASRIYLLRSAELILGDIQQKEPL